MLFDSVYLRSLPWPSLCKVVVALFVWLLASIINLSPLHAQSSWLQSKASDDIAYFLFATPARIERYDFSNDSWLTTINLPARPTAFAVDADGLYVAFDRRVSRFTLNGTDETHLENTSHTIIELFTIAEFLYINHSTYPSGNITSVNKFTGLTIDAKVYRSDVLSGISVARTIGKIFARDSGTSPADIFQVSLNADGTLGAATDSPYHGNYPRATKTFIFPTENRVVDNAGIVYNTTDLTYSNSLAGAIDDIAFYGDLPVVLRAGQLIVYNNALLETGTHTPAQRPEKIYVHEETILAFAKGSTRGVKVAKIDLALLNPMEPGVGVDPEGLAYTPDTTLLGNNDILYLFSKTHLSIFRWSLGEKAYLPTIGLNQAPSHVTYSPATNRLYLAYSSGKLTQIQLSDSLLEQPFANSPRTPCGLATAGEYAFVCDRNYTEVSHITYHPNGSLISQKNYNHFSKEYVWSAANHKMYFFRDGTSPNDIIWEEIDSEGQIGAKQDSPYHSSSGIVHPIRVAPDGSKVVLGSGRIYDAITLNHVDNLSNDISDATWFNGHLYTVRIINNQSQIQKWSSTYGLDNVIELENPTTQLFTTSEGILAVAQYGGVLRFVLLDAALNTLYQSPTLVGLSATNDSPAAVGESVLFQGGLKHSDGSVTYAWDFGDGLQGNGKFASHSYTNAGIYTATLSAQNGVETVTATTRVTITPPTSGDVPITGLTIVTNSPVQVGKPMTLTAKLQAGTNVKYSWNLGDGNLVNGPEVTHIYANAGQYLVALSAANNTSSISVNTTVTVTEAEPTCEKLTAASVQVATPNVPYVGTVQHFSATVEPAIASDNTVSYQWFVNDVAVATENPSSQSFLEYSFVDVGTHTIRVTATNDCSEVSATMNIDIVALPETQPDLSLSSKSVTFANIEAGDILTYTIHLRNRRPVNASVTMTDTLPSHTTYLPESLQASSGMIEAVDGTIRWAGEVISGTPVLISYAVEVQEAPVGTRLTSVGQVRDQSRNTIQLRVSSLYNSGYRLSINQGALYTNQPNVLLTYSWNPTDDIQSVKFSNDGGFGAGATEWLPVNQQTPTYVNWPLVTQNGTLLPRTVYAMFRAADGSQHGPFQDDIILDISQPRLLHVAFVKESNLLNAAHQGSAAEQRVRVTASDENSGIATIEFSKEPAFLTTEAHAMQGGSMDITLATAATNMLYVRAIDRAGNASASYLLPAGGSVQLYLPVITR